MGANVDPNALAATTIGFELHFTNAPTNTSETFLTSYSKAAMKQQRCKTQHISANDKSIEI